MKGKKQILFSTVLVVFLLLCSCQALDEVKEALSSLSPSHKATERLDTKTEFKADKQADNKPVEISLNNSAQKTADKKPDTLPVVQEKPVVASIKKHVPIAEVLEYGKNFFKKVSGLNNPEESAFFISLGNVLLSGIDGNSFNSGAANLADMNEEIQKAGQITSSSLDIWTNDKENKDKVKFAEKSLFLGQKVYLVFRINDRFAITKSRVMAEGAKKPEQKDGSMRFAVLDASANKAFNGALVLNKNKEVAGVVTINEDSAFAMVIEAGELADFMGPAKVWSERYGISLKKKMVPLQASSGLWLGMQVQDLTPELAVSFNLTNDNSGVLVSKVFENGPAFESGIEAGDLITRLAKKKVSTIDDLPEIMKNVKPGQKLSLVIRRDRKSISKNIVPVEKTPE